MKTTVLQKSILFLLLITQLHLTAQAEIYGVFSPAKSFTWLIAYQLKPTSQEYVGSARMEDGVVALELPKNSTSGIYRLVYAVPQEENYFDIIYNGNEPIVFTFDLEAGLQFKSSKENVLLSKYLEEIKVLEEQLMSYYASGKKSPKTFKTITGNLWDTHENYSEKSKGLIANNFIQASRPYIPKKKETLKDYLENKRLSYFKGVDFTNPTLRASDFLIDKVVNYALTVHPLERNAFLSTEDSIMLRLEKVDEILAGLEEEYALMLYYRLWKELNNHRLHKASDFLYETYLKRLAEATGNSGISEEIALDIRLRLGAQAPDISWEKGNESYSLDAVSGAEHYLLIFWSSNCSHCLDELPKLHASLKRFKTLKVIAVGLENTEESWIKETLKFPDFEHAIGLGKWESEYAKLYGIERTPTYIVLDRDKKILAKPADHSALMVFLDEMPN